MADHDPLTAKEFKELGYKKPHAELEKMIQQAHRLNVWFNADEREKLLPALIATQERTAQPGRRVPDPNKPTWEDECNSLGITAELVRQWKRRTAAEQDIRNLLGEQPKKPRVSSKDRNAHAVKHLARLVQAIRDGDDEKIERLAAAFEEYYGF